MLGKTSILELWYIKTFAQVVAPDTSEMGCVMPYMWIHGHIMQESLWYGEIGHGLHGHIMTQCFTCLWTKWNIPYVEDTNIEYQYEIMYNAPAMVNYIHVTITTEVKYRKKLKVDDWEWADRGAMGSVSPIPRLFSHHHLYLYNLDLQ
jgi:hypothetical protein